jgi:hypothetical protein
MELETPLRRCRCNGIGYLSPYGICHSVTSLFTTKTVVTARYGVKRWFAGSTFPLGR